MANGPGRACPVDYRYGAHALAAAATIEAETLYVAGGLYGNPFALDALLELAAAEPGARVVFNGDFNWFNVDAAEFRRINEAVLAHTATRGNVETELAHAERGAGCGCGYPDWVGDAEVERSNRILERLRATAAAERGLTDRLSGLPMFAVARVGETRVGIVHGDADSLAGWAFSQEKLATEPGLSAAASAFETARVGVIASSHTCLPVLQPVATSLGEAVLVNNGAAGMPNFAGTRHGLVTRISVRAPLPNAALYGMTSGGVHVHAIPVHYDASAWERKFTAQWPAGSDGSLSYHQRICNGPAYSVAKALRVIARPAVSLAL
jgi:predicted phosphodiesterase